MLMPIRSIDWEKVGKYFERRGCRLILAQHPMPTGSGTMNGYYFNFLWFGDGNAYFSFFLKSIPEMSSTWTVAIEILSELVLGGRKPICRYSRVNESQWVVTAQWCDEASQEETLERLKKDENIRNLRTLEGKKLT